MAVVAALLIPSCATAPPPKAPLPVPPPPAPQPDPRHGAVSLQIIPDPNSHPPTFEANEQFVAPVITCEAVLPEYPPDALAAKAAPATVVLRVTIGASGRVERIEDSPVMASTPGPFASEFRWSAVRAIRRWQFSAGRIDRTVAQESSGGEKTEWVDVGEPLDVFYDMKFDFEIVAGEGRVRSSVGGTK